MKRKSGPRQARQSDTSNTNINHSKGTADLRQIPATADLVAADLWAVAALDALAAAR